MTSRRQNKFADLISAARETEEETPQAIAPTPAPALPRAREAAPVGLPPESSARTAVEEEAQSAEPPRRGRPPTGKRSNPAYEQVTAYIRKDTNLQTKIALLQEGNTRDFSDLVEELLQVWLRDR